MRTIRMRRAVLSIVSVSAVLTLLQAGIAVADAGGHASCLGFEASALSPIGSSDEAPGGMPELHAYVVQSFPGLPPGMFYSAMAKLHEGSHERCDEAIGG